eukprot:m.224092 g.224092  ORF g.224092 m.224092 type:complete len:835 (-) comp17030_c1_seq1:466-2970(-)
MKAINISLAIGLVLLACFSTSAEAGCGDRIEVVEDKPVCKGGSGLFLPAFNKYGEADWPNGLKIVLYFLGLMWIFSGVGIITDVFMEAIEVITSQEKALTLANNRVIHVRVWNPTIANLSLMALGSSAPEIILSVIEVVGGNFFAGALGPSTIVGSAAYNLFGIISVCILTIPKGETRRLEQYGVFIVTAIFSIFAYLWLLIILVGISPNVVEVWEGVVTFLLFPVLLALSYYADRGAFDCGSKRTTPVETVMRIDDDETHTGRQFHDPFESAAIIKRVAKAEDLSLDDKVNLAMAKHMKPEDISRARFRIDATRKLVGSRAVLPDFEKAKLQEAALKDGFFETNIDELHKFDFVGVESLLYHVGEADGHVNVKIIRTGNLSQPMSVKYRTIGDTATMGVDFEETSGVCEFEAGISEKVIPVKIIDDDEVEDDEKFFFLLEEPSPSSYSIIPGREKASVIIIDDDHPGVITLELSSFSCAENVGTIFMSVKRENGSKGRLEVNYATSDGSAHAPHDYEEAKGTLVFENGEVEKVIPIKICNDDQFEADEVFYLSLEESEGVQFGQNTRCKITILNDDAITTLSEKVTYLLNINMHKFKIGGTDWRSQFIDALAWPEEGSGKAAVVIHLINLPWKLLAACLPPTIFGNGWVTFCSALVFIGIITALIGDLASLMGCAMGLQDAVTAITFVALGTSLPDTFASKSAIVASTTADAAITNITGSNSVNVFLGLGLSWLIAAIYWPVTGKTAEWNAVVPSCLAEQYSNAFFWVPAGDLSISVIVFSVACVICLGVLTVRRHVLGAELSSEYSKPTAALFILLWLCYIIVSAMSTYGYL